MDHAWAGGRLSAGLAPKVGGSRSGVESLQPSPWNGSGATSGYVPPRRVPSSSVRLDPLDETVRRRLCHNAANTHQHRTPARPTREPRARAQAQPNHFFFITPPPHHSESRHIIKQVPRTLTPPPLNDILSKLPTPRSRAILPATSGAALLSPTGSCSSSSNSGGGSAEPRLGPRLRGRGGAGRHGHHARGARVVQRLGLALRLKVLLLGAVSYTHLTLPTICSV